MTCVEPEVNDCLSSRFVFVMFPCRFNVGGQRCSRPQHSLSCTCLLGGAK